MKSIENIEKELRENENLRRELKELYDIDQEKAWQNLKRKNRTQFRFFRKIAIGSSVAAALILLYFGLFYFEKNLNIDTQKIEKLDVGVTYIQTSDGRRLSLNSDTIVNGIASFNKEIKLIKNMAASKNNHSKNCVVVPRGESVRVELSDGTLVWLNSDSKFIYPIHFEEDTREVELIGEAFFEVVSNKDKPFLVKGNNLDVMVTGTQFNISNYTDTQQTSVTLVEGVVSVETANFKGQLQPSEQLIIDRENGDYTKCIVNTSLYTSWTKDIIYFKDMPLENIAIILDKWYGLSLKYKNLEISKEVFTGEIYRHDLPEQILTYITKAANLNWQLTDKRTILIY